MSKQHSLTTLFLLSTKMTLIYSVILCILFMVVSCQLQCDELTNEPTVTTGLMTEGQSSSLTCRADTLCYKAPTIHWIWEKADGQSVVLHRRSVVYYGDAFTMYENELELTPTAEDHNTNITCAADYDGYVVNRTVSLSVRFPPKILNSSWCMVEGKHAVRCVCISQGNPPPQITWSSVPLTSSSSIGTVSSTITMDSADNITCLSRNALGQVESDIPLQSDTDNYGPKMSGATIPWIIAGVSLSLNLVLLTTLIICTCKRGRGQQREPREEMNYASLNRADVGQEYSVISPRTRDESRDGTHHHGNLNCHPRC